MRFSIADFSFQINRRSSENKVCNDDFGLINEDIEKYIRNLTEKEIASRVESVSAISLDDSESVSKLIKNAGIVVIPNFVESRTVDSFQESFSKIYKICDALSRSEKKYLDEKYYLAQKGGVKISGYSNLANYDKPVIQIREGKDVGMIDVFNVDQLSRDFKVKLRPFFEHEPLLELLGSCGSANVPSNFNLYMNQSIMNTRGFHVDSYASQVKAFLYLSDVTELRNGPYTYVKKSHQMDEYRRFNKKVSEDYNNTEAPILPCENIIPVLAPKGSLVISDQAGIHRGFPQQLGGCRCVAVMNYK